MQVIDALGEMNSNKRTLKIEAYKPTHGRILIYKDSYDLGVV